MTVVASLSALPSGWGQEALRMSQANSQASDAHARAAQTLGYYNLAWGPTLWNFNTGLALEANDNIRLTGLDPKSDLIFSPSINTRMRWPVSDYNCLNLSFGAGYAAYLTHSEYDRLFITPGTDLSFDIFVADVRINLHDRLSILQNNYADPTIAGNANPQTFQNSVGVGGVWNLNKITLRSGYDHLNSLSLGSGFAGQDRTSETVYLSGAYAVQPELLVGLDLGGALVNYAGTGGTIPQTMTQWSLGPFCDWRLSDYLKLLARVGCSGTQSEATGAAPMSSSTPVPYYQLDLTHRVNQYLDQTLSGGRMVTLTYSTGMLDLYFVRWQANWRLFQNITLGTSFVYENGSYLQSNQETFDRYGPGLSVSRPLSRKLTASMAYQYYNRESNLPYRTYTDNVLTLSFNYKF